MKAENETFYISNKIDIAYSVRDLFDFIKINGIGSRRKPKNTVKSRTRKLSINSQRYKGPSSKEAFSTLSQKAIVSSQSLTAVLSAPPSVLGWVSEIDQK